MTFSIIQKSQLEGANRVDAEYYQPEYLAIGKLLSNSKKMSDLTKTVDLQSNGAFAQIFAILNDNNEKTVPYIRSENLGDFFINTNGLAFISKEAHEKLSKTQTKLDDILMAGKGKIGGATLITKDAVDYNSNDNVVNIKINDKNYLNPYYFITFFNCKIGLKQIERCATGNVQPWLSMYQVRNLNVFVPDYNFQIDIENIVKLAQLELINSQGFYQQAENLLLEKLGLADFMVVEDLSYIVNYSDTKEVDRVDADYFQPKYQIISEKIKTNNAKLLGNLVTLKKGFEPGSEAYQEEGKLFIRVSSLSKYGIEDKDQKYLPDELYQKLKPNYEPKVGEILLTKDATPGISYVVKEPIEGIISGGILRLKLKSDIEPEYLSLCISSLIGQMQAERDAGGSIIVHWKPEQIKNILIPVLPKETQAKIADLIKKSHIARKKSKELLEEAKRKVEEIIEKGGDEVEEKS